MGYFHHPIMQYVIFFGRGGGGSVHKNNTSYLPLGLYHASVNLISIVLTKITPTKWTALWDWWKYGEFLSLDCRFLVSLMGSLNLGFQPQNLQYWTFRGNHPSLAHIPWLVSVSLRGSLVSPRLQVWPCTKNGCYWLKLTEREFKFKFRRH